MKGACSFVEFLCELCDLGLQTSQIQKRPKLACACSDLLVLCMCLLMLSLCLHAWPVLSPLKSSYGTVQFSCINLFCQKCLPPGAYEKLPAPTGTICNPFSVGRLLLDVSIYVLPFFFGGPIESYFSRLRIVRWCHLRDIVLQLPAKHALPTAARKLHASHRVFQT